jgi:hypothetical protein
MVTFAGMATTTRTVEQRLTRLERTVEDLRQTIARMKQRADEEAFLLALHMLSDGDAAKLISLTAIRDEIGLDEIDAFNTAKHLSVNHGLVEYPGCPGSGPYEYRLTAKGRRHLRIPTT